MHFVAVKAADQQVLAALHRLRESLICNRTAAINQVHGFLLEFGISLPIGHVAIERLPVLLDQNSEMLPPRMVAVLMYLHGQIQHLNEEIKDIETDLKRQLKEDDAGSRLLTIPALVRSPPVRWLPMRVMLQTSNAAGISLHHSGWYPASIPAVANKPCWASANEETSTCERLLVQGACAVMMRIDQREDALGPWVRALMGRRHLNVVACALANKLAHIVWAVLAKAGLMRPTRIRPD